MSRIALPFALLLMLSVTACHSTPSEASSTATPADTSSAASTPASPVADTAKRCDAGKAQAAVGQTASQDVVDKAVGDSGSGTARVIKPGQAVTMDFREDRLNIEVDGGNVITAVRCG